MKTINKRLGLITKLKNNRKKGSATVEASLVFPFFLSFILLIVFLIKVACINITLNYAVNETVRQLSSVCYPISFINEIEDEIASDGNGSIPSFSEELVKAGNYLKDNFKNDDGIAKLLSGEFSAEDIKGIFSATASQVIDDYKSGVKGELISQFAGKYYEIKTTAKYYAVRKLLSKYCEGTHINSDDVVLLFVSLPQGNFEREIRENDPAYIEACEKINYHPAQDDVLVAVEYKIHVPIPFFKNINITIKHLAVEKAWLNGYTLHTSAGSSSNSEDKNDGGQFENLLKDLTNQTVYITRTGKKYHTEDCRYLAKSCIPIDIREAEERDYTPCKVCW